VYATLTGPLKRPPVGAMLEGGCSLTRRVKEALSCLYGSGS
jgi:hypothetical protein